jgi:hypothetical protein
MEHVNFACAMMGMAMRLPILRPALQRIVDASGGGPMRVRRRGEGTACVRPRIVETGG